MKQADTANRLADFEASIIGQTLAYIGVENTALAPVSIEHIASARRPFMPRCTPKAVACPCAKVGIIETPATSQLGTFMELREILKFA